jgi:hypothetical protein
MNALPQSEWLTASEAADYLKVKPRSLLLWVRQGKLQAYPSSLTPLFGRYVRGWKGRTFLAGNWSLRELADRLEQVGVVVSVENAQSSSVEK